MDEILIPEDVFNRAFGNRRKRRKTTADAAGGDAVQAVLFPIQETATPTGDTAGDAL